VAVRFVVTTELALGADLTASPATYSWTDISDRVHTPSKIQITRGRGDRYATTAPARASLTLLNNDGLFVPRNPVGDYYGQLARNTPLRVMVRPNTNSLSDAFTRTASSSWGSADSGGAWTNSGGAASDFSVSSTNGGRHLHTSAAVRHTSLLGLSIVRSDQTVKMRVNATSTGAAQSAGIALRYTDASNFRRAELQFGTTGTITARFVVRTAGVDVVNASEVTTLTHSTSTWVWLRVQTGSTEVRVKAWADGADEPATWILDGADGTATAAVAGTLGLTSMRETGNTNSNATIDFDTYSMVDGPRVRFTGFVDSWPVRWADASLSQSLAPITATGLLRRLGQQQTLRSALFRASTLGSVISASTIVAYWPMEDANNAEWFASGITGHRPLFFDEMSPAADSSIAGSDPLPTCDSGAVYYGDVAAYAASTAWSIGFIFKLPASPSTATGLLSWTSGGTAVQWALELTPGSPDVLRLRAYNSAGTELLADAGMNFVDSASAELLNQQLYMQVTATQNGGNIDWAYTVYTAAGAFGHAGSVAATIGNLRRFYHSAYPGLTAGGYTVGHILAAMAIGGGPGFDGATGFNGETTKIRFQRLCYEQGLWYLFGDLSLGIGTAVQTMGPQRATTFIAQLREVEAAESGVLHDGKEGITQLLPRTMRQSRPVALTLDVAQGQVGWPMEPDDDDYLLRNDVTVSRQGGSSSRATDSTSVTTEGVYPESATINCQLDTDLRQHANWRLNQGTTEDLRYPQVVIDLTRNQDLIEDWCDSDIGSRVQVTNVPVELPPDDLDLIIEGYTEVIDQVSWKAAANMSPAAPWNVFTVQGGGNSGRVGTTSTLTAGVNSSATSLSVTTATGNALWRSGAVNFDIGVAGERMTVTNVSGTTSPQTFTVTRSVNGVVKAQATSATIKLWRPGRWSL